MPFSTGTRILAKRPAKNYSGGRRFSHRLTSGGMAALKKGWTMPAPASSAEFIELVRKSTVVEEKRLDAVLEKLRAAGTLPPDPGKLAGLLITEGLLTQFQAQQILQGKWKRFTIGKYKVLEQ